MKCTGTQIIDSSVKTSASFNKEQQQIRVFRSAFNNLIAGVGRKYSTTRVAEWQGIGGGVIRGAAPTGVAGPSPPWWARQSTSTRRARCGIRGAATGLSRAGPLKVSGTPGGVGPAEGAG